MNRDFVDALRETLGLTPLYFQDYDEVRYPERQWIRWMDRVAWGRNPRAHVPAQGRHY